MDHEFFQGTAVTSLQFALALARAKALDPTAFSAPRRQLTHEDIEHLEMRLGIPLPTDFRTFLLDYGDAGFGPAILLSPWPDDPAPIPRPVTVAYAPAAFLPIGESGTGDLYGFQIDGGRCLPTVYCWEHDTRELAPLYPDFYTFLADQAFGYLTPPDE